MSSSRISKIKFSASAIFFLFFIATVGALHAQSGPADNDAAHLHRLILEGARSEAEKGTPYIQQYHVLPYPGGDVPPDTGVCTDLVIRAFRNAGIDLQRLVHEDRVAHPEAYPIYVWDYKPADANIDHRRCQNLVVWFKRFTESLPTSLEPTDLPNWQQGDVVFYIRERASHPWHVAVISDKKDFDGRPFVIDAYPPRTSEQNRLNAWAPIHSHFRITSPAPRIRTSGARP